jgi:O-succinylbenzoic acid--CoA ligase
MRKLGGIDLPLSTEFVSALQSIWDAGDCAFPIDQRLPHAQKTYLVEDFGVHEIITTDGHKTMGQFETLITENDAVVFTTSGSSGDPKGVVHTHQSLRSNADIVGAYFGDTSAMHWLACLPTSHVGGFGVISRALHWGCALTSIAQFDAEQVEAFARSGVTHTSLVATALGRIDPALFEHILLGGAKPPPSLPHNVTTTYGLTETMGGVAYNRSPLPGIELRIAHDQEILVRGSVLMNRYYETTRGVPLIHPIDSDGWLHTGDLGSMSPDNQLTVTGRQNELIISGGENIWPEAVEAALVNHPDVSDVCVVGVDDQEWGQRVVAFIVPANASTSPSLAEWREFVAESLPRFMAPRQVVLLNNIPRSALGKPLRQALRDKLSS